MLTREQKESRWSSFIESGNFGKHNWITIFLSKINLSYEVTVVQLLLKIVKDDKFANAFDKFTGFQELRMKQHLTLTCILKIQICIEATLVLVHALSKGRQNIAEVATNYDDQLPRQVIHNIRTAKYDLKKILAFLDPKAFPLNEDEKLLLRKLYDESAETIQQVLLDLADFYDRYHILYLKMKHGLTFETGAGINTGKELPTFTGSLVFAYHSLGDVTRMPRGSIKTNRTGYNKAEWFNVMSVLAINENLERDIEKALHNLIELNNYLVQNQLNYGANCGDTYLPWLKVDAEHSIPLFYPKSKLSDNEVSELDAIAGKIFALMNMKDFDLRTEKQLKDERLVSDIVTGPITNIWTGNFRS